MPVITVVATDATASPDTTIYPERTTVSCCGAAYFFWKRSPFIIRLQQYLSSVISALLLGCCWSSPGSVLVLIVAVTATLGRWNGTLHRSLVILTVSISFVTG